MKRKFDEYELQAIRSNIKTIEEYAILKTTQGVPNVSKLIKVGKREKLSICYTRCDDSYFLELSNAECKAIMIEYEYDNIDETLDKFNKNQADLIRRLNGK